MSAQYGPGRRGRLVITWSRPGRYTFPAPVLDNVVHVQDADTGEQMLGIFQMRLVIGSETEYRPGILTVELVEAADENGDPVRGKQWTPAFTNAYREHRARVAAFLADAGGDVLALTDEQVEQMRDLEGSFTGFPVRRVTSTYYVAEMRLEAPDKPADVPQPDAAPAPAEAGELDPFPGCDREC